MSTAPTDTVMLAVSLIALTLAFVAHMVTERHRSMGLKRDAHPQSVGMTAGTGHALLRTGGSTAGSASPTRDAPWPASSERTKRATPTAAAASGMSESDATRFLQAWSALQGRFVDNPKGAVAEADELVRDLLELRGYSLDERIDHPAVVTTYLAAQAITARPGRSEADTEALRKAVVYYRGLFDMLLSDAPATARA